MIDILLYRTENPKNLGSIARVAANFGFENILLVDPQCNVTDHSRHLAKKGQATLENMRTVSEEILSEYDLLVMTQGIAADEFNMARSSVAPKELFKELEKYTGKIGIVFGPEGDGLYPDMLRNADIILTIPTVREAPSLNLAMSVGIVLYELQELLAKETLVDSFTLAKREENQVLENTINELVESQNFPNPARKETLKLAWKRVLGKGMLTSKEVMALLGFFKKLK
jgi:tRNA/rRNA methyltransferase